MISAILFMLYVSMLIIIPAVSIHPPKMVRRLRFAIHHSANGQKFLAYILALLVIFFHLVYFNAFHGNKGIMLSTLLVFFLLATKRTVQLLRFVHDSKYFFAAMTILVLITAFFPTLFSTAASLAFVLNFVCLLPMKSITPDVPQTEANDHDKEE